MSAAGFAGSNGGGGPGRVVADLGNSRLKWARLSPDGRPGPVAAVPLDALDGWSVGGLDGQRWAISSVNPASLQRLRARLEDRGVASVRVFGSAADVPLRHDLEAPDRTGADRALAVLGGLGLVADPERAGLVVSCGTAVTVERIEAGGLWRGGAIAAGLGPLSWALHDLTAQLPQVSFDPEAEPPASFGRSTGPAIQAGLHWGLVGAVRELTTRARVELGGDPWVIWTGGDAAWLGRAVDGPTALVIPDLVLRGLAVAAFGASDAP